jgi:hypothetical protein
MLQPRQSENSNFHLKLKSSTLTALAPLLFILAASLPASAATLQVGDCQGVTSPYTTIQQAVDAAAAGDTVEVCPATYAEAITIDKNLTLEGIHLTEAHPGELIATLPTITYPNSGESLRCLGPAPVGESVCPQILVQNATNVTISTLNVDGSTFPRDCQTFDPAGIAFLDGGGSVTNANVTNHECGSEQVSGEGLYVFPINSDESINFSNNTIYSFGDTGIYVSLFAGHSALNGSITQNQISSTVNHSFYGIGFYGPSNQFTITGNNISAPDGTDGYGIAVANSTGAAVGVNVVNNFDVGIGFNDNSSTNVALNIISSAFFNGIYANCSSNSNFVANGIAGVSSPPAGSSGIDVSDNGCQGNRIYYNVIDRFCAGVLDESTGYTIDDNLFENIGPGGDVRTTTCP